MDRASQDTWDRPRARDDRGHAISPVLGSAGCRQVSAIQHMSCPSRRRRQSAGLNRLRKRLRWFLAAQPTWAGRKMEKNGGALEHRRLPGMTRIAPKRTPLPACPRLPGSLSYAAPRPV